MSKTFVYDRFDIHWHDQETAGAFDGEWVKAEDAINRDAVLNAKIQTLETQLTDANALLAYIEKIALVTPYGGGWVGFYDIRSIPAFNDFPDSRFKYKTFIEALKAAMAKDAKR